MIVSGEQGFGSGGRIVEVFRDAPGDGDAIVGGSAPPDLVQEDQATGCNIVDNAGCFVHFDHEGGFSTAEVVGGAYAGKDLIGERDPGCVAGDKAAHVRHEGDEGSLPEQGAFTAHVRARQDNDLL